MEMWFHNKRLALNQGKRWDNTWVLLTMLMSLMMTTDIERWEPRVGCWLLKYSGPWMLIFRVHYSLRPGIGVTFFFHVSRNRGCGSLHSRFWRACKHAPFIIPSTMLTSVHAAALWSKHLIGQACLDEMAELNVWIKKQQHGHQRMVD